MFEMEQFLSQRLRDHGGLHVEDGATTPEIRAQRMREAITAAGVAEVVIGRAPDGKAMRYRQAFQRCYGVPL